MARQDARLIGLSMSAAFGLGRFAQFEEEEEGNQYGIPGLTDEEVDAQSHVVTCHQLSLSNGVMTALFIAPDGEEYTDTFETVFQKMLVASMKEKGFTGDDVMIQLTMKLRGKFFLTEEGWECLSSFCED